jgi:hypothetical protein
MRTILTMALLVGCGDSGITSDMQAAGGSCTLNGKPCDPDIGCSSGVNWCGCRLDGVSTGSQATCLQVGCVESDAGVCPGTSCHATSECPSGQRCAFVGCASDVGVCTAVGACNQFAPGPPPLPNSKLTICDCSAHTVTIDWICGVEQPYAYVGACH